VSVLSAETQSNVEQELIKGGYITENELAEAHKKADTEGTPFLTLLVSDGHITSELLTKILAEINHVPYVNLSNAFVDENILALLPQDIAEHYMAVPLGEMQNRLVVGMLDADNVQAVDFLSNKIGRPLKVYAASEDGIRNVLKQYRTHDL
jgi:hypothetical protein